MKKGLGNNRKLNVKYDVKGGPEPRCEPPTGRSPALWIIPFWKRPCGAGVNESPIQTIRAGALAFIPVLFLFLMIISVLITVNVTTRTVSLGKSSVNYCMTITNLESL